MLNKIVEWFRACYPNVTPEVASIQYGCLVEEIGETMQVTEDLEYVSDFGSDALDISYVSRNYKHSNPTCVQFLQELEPIYRTEHLDGLVDIIWTAVTSGTAMGYDMQGALDEVIRSNYSKFENGKPVFDENGKVAKGKDYTKPDLHRFANPEVNV